MGGGRGMFINTTRRGQWRNAEQDRGEIGKKMHKQSGYWREGEKEGEAKIGRERVEKKDEWW
jgi:hypothetical protein